MEHKMRLYDEPFNQILNDVKHYEYRLNDEKRKLINIGDTIEFRKVSDESKTLRVKVLDLLHYDTMTEMFKDTFDDYLYKYYDTPEDASKDTKIYSKEEIQEYGCLAIKIEKIL